MAKKKVGTDPKELKEREEAAKRYSEEDSRHFVEFLNECVKLSTQSMQDIRMIQDECLRIYREEEPYTYASKEQWQSRIVYPKPFKLVRSGAAIIRKIFEMEFLTVDQAGDQKAADFWKDLLTILLGRNYGNFPVVFADATTMALAAGQSHEVIPYWDPGNYLKFCLVEPFRIHRDPDALPRQPQSGEYWVHQEFMYYHHLRAMEKLGRYKDTEGLQSSTTKTADQFSSEEESARRKGMILQKTKFHHAVLTYEFWGTILSPKGEILLDNATYTVAADRVISQPRRSPYPKLRWPGVGYSALPDINRWDGRGLIQGIRSLWYLMCNLMSLHADHLNWIVNPMMEMDVMSLIDQQDTDIYPGKTFRTHATQQGQQVVRTIDFRSEVSDIMAILNFFDQRHQDGGMLDYHMMGLPGYRAEVTKGEAAQNLDQSMILAGDMGKNVEDGCLNIIMACAETARTFMTYGELKKIMPDEADKYRVEVSAENPTGLDLPELGTGAFKVSGISGVMRDQEILKHLYEMKEMFSQGSVFLPFLEPYYYLKAIERRAYLKDEKIVLAEERAKPILEAQQRQQEAEIQHQAGTDSANVDAARSMADKNAALAEKARGEAAANEAQAGLFGAQAGAIGGPGGPAEGMPGAAVGGAGTPMPPQIPGAMPEEALQ